jgi:hypothetical protein
VLAEPVVGFLVGVRLEMEAIFFHDSSWGLTSARALLEDDAVVVVRLPVRLK